MRDLAAELESNQWALSASAISQIENGARRVDVDDLFALAIALDVTPALLLMPEAHSADERVDGPAPFGTTSASHVWAYLLLDPPPGDPLNEWWEDPREKGLAPIGRWLSRVSKDSDSSAVWRAFTEFMNSLQAIEKGAQRGDD